MNNFISKHYIWHPAFLLRGMNVKPMLEEYKKTQYTDFHRIRERQFNNFKKVINFSYKNIEFYRNKFHKARMHPDDIQHFDDINKIPILTKSELIENYNVIYNPNFKGRKFKRSTSGSTGSPLIFYKDAHSLSVMDAILYRNYSWYGIDIGYRQAKYWGHPLKRFDLFKSRLIDRLLNRMRLTPFKLDADAFKTALKSIVKFKAQYIYGYAQSVFQFSQYYYKKDIDLSYLGIKAVILTGEMIFPNQIKIIKKVFQCDVAQEYGCTEVGLIGFQCEYGNMHLMENLLVEDIENPADMNSRDIIVSELYGRLFPFIRYQVGDKGRISKAICTCGRNMLILEELSGRRDDFIKCSNGRLVDPYLLEYIIAETPSNYGLVSQFRIIQKKIDLLQIYLVGSGNLNKLEKYIADTFIGNLSDDMNLEISFASSIPKDASGKLRCFISEIP